MGDFNQGVIEEFRANAGVVGGYFEGKNMILVHHHGTKSGKEYTTPLVYQPLEGGGLAVFASAGGAPNHPTWYHNLVANPDATVEIGTETFGVRARVAEGEERERIWTRQKEELPGYAEYEVNAAPREIPVIVLERAAA
jgi:deazaflavin-dependent oxidoreductase (nitroreductase family)